MVQILRQLTSNIIVFFIKSEGRTALIWAALQGHIATVKLLIESGAKIKKGILFKLSCNHELCPCCIEKMDKCPTCHKSF